MAAGQRGSGGWQDRRACRYIAADIENAGGHYVDEQLHVDDANGFKLITSRKPDDLDYFVDAIKDALK